MAKWEPNDRAQLHKDANKALDEHLAADEAVRVIIRGPGNSAMISTDRRVFVFKKGILSRRDLATFDYEEISGVALKKGIVQGHIALQGPGLQTTGIGHGDKEVHPDKVPHALAIIDQNDVEARVALLRKSIDSFHAAARQPAAGLGSASIDIPDQIRKLGELRDAGILTTQEFDAKKADLLSRL